MKVAVSANSGNLDAQIDPRFGRCSHFLIIDTDDMSFEAFNNDNIALGGGAGIQSAQFVASKGAKVVITGNIGPNAMRTLSAACIEVIAGQTGTVRQVLEDYKKGNLKSTAAANVADHYGMSFGRARAESSPLSKEEELYRLKEQARELKKQIEAMESLVEKLVKE